jgi:hypothetical protein
MKGDTDYPNSTILITYHPFLKSINPHKTVHTHTFLRHVHQLRESLCNIFCTNNSTFLMHQVIKEYMGSGDSNIIILQR